MRPKALPWPFDLVAVYAPWGSGHIRLTWDARGRCLTSAAGPVSHTCQVVTVAETPHHETNAILAADWLKERGYKLCHRSDDTLIT